MLQLSNIMEELEIRIWEARIRLNLPRAEFALLIGVSTTALFNYEVGDRVPNVDVLMRICEEAEVNPIWLLWGHGPQLQKDSQEYYRKISLVIIDKIREILNIEIDEEKNIRRIIDGVYEKPVYSNLLREYVPANPEKVAYAIARGFHWTIAPCGDVALNKLGLSTQVPVVWSYISDGPYRKFSWDNITLSFKHRANREISYMSETTTLVVEALKTLGKDRVDDGIILSLRNRLPREEKKKMLVEATSVSEWIYTVIRKVCAE
mgnify:CR=1 FL=1